MFAKLLSMIGLRDDSETAEARRRMSADAADPRRRFVFGLLAVSYELDPGYLVEHATTAVGDWYGIASRDELQRRFRDYLEGGSAPPGYDIFRAVFLARAGHAAGLLGEEESWALAFQGARKAQASYPSFAAYGAGYLEGHITYRQSQGDTAATLARCRQNIGKTLQELQRGPWARTPYDVAF